MRKALPFQLLLLCSILSGCVKGGIYEQEFISGGKNISLSVEGKTVFSYTEANHQFAYNSGRNEFRAYTDSFSKYFILTCDSRPARAGDEVRARLTYTDHKNNKITENGIFRVSKINDDDGRTLWLWNSDKRIGVIVKELR